MRRLDFPRSQRYKRMVWIGVIIVIAFITVCEIALFIARRSPFVARPYGLGYLVRSGGEARNTDGDPDRPVPRDENERL